MLGRLPMRYQVAIWVTGLVSFTTVGAWLALTTPIPLVWPSGALLGAVVGTVAVAMFLVALGQRPQHAAGRPAAGRNTANRPDH